MSENPTEVLTGGAVLAVAAGFFIWAAQGAGFGSGPGSYPLHASFRSVEGISLGSDVRLGGVSVGSVTALALNPETFFADATISLRSDIELPSDSAVLVSSESLLGGSYIELIPGGSFDNLIAGDHIEDTQGAVSLMTLLMRFVDGGGIE